MDEYIYIYVDVSLLIHASWTWFISVHDDVKLFPRYWLFVRGIHRSPVNSPHIGPITRSFDVFFDLHLNKRLNKQSRRRWFETPSRPLWLHCNEKRPQYVYVLRTSNQYAYICYPPVCISNYPHCYPPSFVYTYTQVARIIFVSGPCIWFVELAKSLDTLL